MGWMLSSPFSSESPLRRCTSLPSDLDLQNNRSEDTNTLPMTPETSPTFSHTFTWNTHSEVENMTLTPPRTPSLSSKPGLEEASVESPKSAGGDCGLGKAVDWVRSTPHSSSNHWLILHSSKLCNVALRMTGWRCWMNKCKHDMCFVVSLSEINRISSKGNLLCPVSSFNFPPQPLHQFLWKD